MIKIVLWREWNISQHNGTEVRRAGTGREFCALKNATRALNITGVYSLCLVCLRILEIDLLMLLSAADVLVRATTKQSAGLPAISHAP